MLLIWSLLEKFRNPRLQEFIKELMEAARHSVSTLSQGPGTQTPTANARKVFWAPAVLPGHCYLSWYDCFYEVVTSENLLKVIFGMK